MDSNTPQDVIIQILVLFFAIGLHEYAHCKFADMAGDPTPGIYGRVTLNLFKHFEPAGTIMMVLSSIIGYGIGWGRPSPMDPRKMRNPRWDHFIAVIAGPVSNVLQALLYAALFRLTIKSFIAQGIDAHHIPFFVQLCLTGVILNMGLAIFNMIPFGPLDGKWLLGLLLPERQRIQWFQLNRQIGFSGLFIVIIFLQYTHINLIWGPAARAANTLLGIEAFSEQ